MAHHIYTTEGFVLGSVPFGESNSFLYIFTRELGLIPASARSVRELKSKLRYGLQDFCHSSISFVRGKHEWKITSALPKKNLYHLFAQNPGAQNLGQQNTDPRNKDKFLVCAHALSLIKKLVAGEEKNEMLFDIVSSGFQFLEENDLTPRELLNVECIMMLRIVYNLGYLVSDSSLKIFLDKIDWDRELISQMETHRSRAIREINKSIKESQL